MLSKEEKYYYRPHVNYPTAYEYFDERQKKLRDEADTIAFIGKVVDRKLRITHTSWDVEKKIHVPLGEETYGYISVYDDNHTRYPHLDFYVVEDGFQGKSDKEIWGFYFQGYNSDERFFVEDGKLIHETIYKTRTIFELVDDEV